jgi:hypothetical protein
LRLGVGRGKEKTESLWKELYKAHAGQTNAGGMSCI